MSRGRARRYLLTKQGYYPQVVADAGYSVWDWDASRLSTLYQDSAKTTPVTANSDPVGAWVDGVQGVTASQATTANKPTYVTGSLTGLPTLSFDGGDLLSTANISISTFALWIVVKNSGTTRIPYEHSVQTISNDGAVQLTLVSGGNVIFVRRSGVLSSKNATALSTVNWTLSRHEHTGTHATHKLFYNNVDVTSAGTNANDIGTGTATAPFFIGARSGVAGGIIGNIAHLCIVSPYPTDAIIAKMESYINGLWGVY